MCIVDFINTDGLRVRSPYETHLLRRKSLTAQGRGVAWERKCFLCFEFPTKRSEDSNCVPPSLGLSESI